MDGVKAYREEFEPNADDLIAKFTEISNEGYAAFVKHSMSDVNVKNAVINALYDEMEAVSYTHLTLPTILLV